MARDHWQDAEAVATTVEVFAERVGNGNGSGSGSGSGNGNGNGNGNGSGNGNGNGREPRIQAQPSFRDLAAATSP